MFTYKTGNPIRTTHQGWAPSVVCKCSTMVEVTDCDKHSRFFWHGLNYGRKKFYSTSSLVYFG